jgi:NAD(P)H dehydrogenase (quinone)
MKQMIAVTGASGALGRRIAAALADEGTPQRLLGRDPARLPVLDAASHHAAAYDDGPAMRAALTGATTMVLVSAGLSGRRLAEHVTAIDAAVAAGVQHVVYVSLMGAAPAATYLNARDHWQTERYLAAAPVTATVLRPSFYAAMLPGLASDGVLRGPAGDGRVAAVAHDDIADVAAAVLLDGPGSHDGEVLEVTGPESLTLTEIAQRLSDALGHPFRYQPETVEEAFASRVGLTGRPPDGPRIDGWVSWYLAIAAGDVATVTDVVPRLTGHPARTIADVVRTAAPR